MTSTEPAPVLISARALRLRGVPEIRPCSGDGFAPRVTNLYEMRMYRRVVRLSLV